MIDEKKLIEKLKQYNSNNIVAIGIIDLINILNEQPKVGEWIPCSERLPEVEGNYLITNHNEEVCEAIFLCGEVWVDPIEEYYGYSAIAWMPLPEPYTERGGKNEEVN